MSAYRRERIAYRKRLAAEADRRTLLCSISDVQSEIFREKGLALQFPNFSEFDTELLDALKCHLLYLSDLDLIDQDDYVEVAVREMHDMFDVRVHGWRYE